jgi:hypothetical protein
LWTFLSRESYLAIDKDKSNDSVTSVVFIFFQTIGICKIEKENGWRMQQVTNWKEKFETQSVL